MKLACCIITKGDAELEKLKTAIESVYGAVDEIVITTNGEDKNTKAYYKDDNKIKLTHLPWNDDFSEQRNFNFSQVSPDTDYCFWLDSDDVILNANKLRDTAYLAKKQNLDCVFFEYWYGAKFDGKPSPETLVDIELNQMRERLIKPGTVEWKKRIHETPVPIDDANFKYSQIKHKDSDIAWLHLGADRDEKQEILDARMVRNRRLLEKELEDEKKRGETDPRTVLYLMKIYAEDEEEATLTRCVEMGKDYLGKSGWDEERATCYQLMSKCIGKLGDHEQARDFLFSAIAEYPHNALLYLYLARVYANLENYSAMKHWMKVGLSLSPDQSNTAMRNILEMKILSAELMLEYYWKGERNIRAAWESAQLLNKLNPTENNQKNENYLYDQKELDIASEHAHKMMKYLIAVQREDLVEHVYNAMPPEMNRLPFAYRYYNRYKKPRVWEKHEICYYATTGGEHFEQWDGNSLEKGIGGSETAVIQLAREWVKAGYKVTVYGDPGTPKTIDGVEYVPWYMFNPKDKFHTFIQWRSNHLAGKVSAKRFLVDMHDVFHPKSFIERVDQIDRIMVKSEAHREFGRGIADYKFNIIGNAIS